MTWEFPKPPACSDPADLIVLVDAAGETLELPLPPGWDTEAVATTLAEIHSL